MVSSGTRLKKHLYELQGEHSLSLLASPGLVYSGCPPPPALPYGRCDTTWILLIHKHCLGSKQRERPFLRAARTQLTSRMSHLILLSTLVLFSICQKDFLCSDEKKPFSRHNIRPSSVQSQPSFAP